MAITLTIEELRIAVRAGDSPEELSDLTRLLAVGTALVLNHAPSSTGRYSFAGRRHGSWPAL